MDYFKFGRRITKVVAILVLSQISHPTNGMNISFYERSFIINNDPLVPCKVGWKYFDNKCYILANDSNGILEFNWNDAAQLCLKLGGYLASIHSHDFEQHFILNVLRENIKNTWIGLHETRDNFVWHDDSPLTYTNWNHHEPSTEFNGEQKRCVEIVTDSSVSIGKWNVADCDMKKPFICQNYKDETLNTPSDIYCPPSLGGGIRFRESCYNPVFIKRNWESAENYCIKHFYGHLASVSGIETIWFLEKNFKDIPYLWIGLEYQHSKAKDGIPKCVLLAKDEGAYIESCKNRYPFICEVPINEKRISISFCSGKYNDWINFGGEKCYYLSKEELTWQHAHFDCMQRGGVLTSIHTEEYDYFKQLNWLHENAVHIGLYRMFNGKFRWADGSELDTELWDEGEPSNFQELCVALNMDSMKWNDISCDILHKYICSVKKSRIFDKKNILKGFEETSHEN